MNNTDSIEALKIVLAAQPEKDAVRQVLVGLLVEDEQLEQAQEVLEYHEVDSLLRLAEAISTENSALALVYLDTCLRKDKACAHAYLLKSKAYASLGDMEKALKFYSIAAVIDEHLESEEYEAMLKKSKVSYDAPPRSVEVSSAGKGLGDNEKKLPMAAVQQNEGGDTEGGGAETEEVTFEEEDAALEQLLNQNLITFAEVGGMEPLKERIRMSIIYPFTKPEIFAKFKKKSGGGILLYGPPGCGKTLISKATAGECGAHFIEISIHDVLSKWIGEAEQRVHSLFEVARRKAPTIIFIDEIDALCVKRADAGNSASLVNTLLTEIDGATSNNEEILVIGATNTPWRIDSAFRRPGRFDHVLFVPPPDQQARESIFQLALDGVPQEALDLSKLAAKSDRFSGADIAAVVSAATDQVIEKMMKTGKESLVEEKMLLRAIKKHRPTTLEWLEQASNYASYANQSGLYDELADFIKG